MRLNWHSTVHQRLHQHVLGTLTDTHETQHTIPIHVSGQYEYEEGKTNIASDEQSRSFPLCNDVGGSFSLQRFHRTPFTQNLVIWRVSTCYEWIPSVLLCLERQARDPIRVSSFQVIGVVECLRKQHVVILRCSSMFYKNTFKIYEEWCAIRWWSSFSGRTCSLCFAFKSMHPQSNMRFCWQLAKFLAARADWWTYTLA